MRNLIFLSLLSVLLAPLGMAQATPEPIDKNRLSVTEQRTAIVDCQYDLGVGGWPRFNVTYVEVPWGSQSTLTLLPGGRISAEEAAWINACADKKLGRNSGAVVAQPTRRRCPSVMMGGSGYCFNR